MLALPRQYGSRHTSDRTACAPNKEPIIHSSVRWDRYIYTNVTMDAPNGVTNPRKRRRRRRLDRPPISARLLLDDRIKGEVGALSEDLFNDLFPAPKSKGKDIGM